MEICILQVKIWFQNRRMKWKRSKKSSTIETPRNGDCKKDSTDNDKSKMSTNTVVKSQNNMSGCEMYDLDDDPESEEVDIDDIDDDESRDGVLSNQNITGADNGMQSLESAKHIFALNQFQTFQKDGV